MSIKKILSEHFLIVIFLVFFASITTYKFIVHPTPFYDWDEGIYAQVGREMMQKPSLVPLWQNQVWLDKPPLVPLFYGLVGLLPIKPEYSLRFATLGLTIFALALVYIFYYRLIKKPEIPFLTVAVTALVPLFVQRAQVLNVDVFLLIGWYGYLVFFPKFWSSLGFLLIGVLSKSTLGFYPAVVLLFYYVVTSYLRKQGSRIDVNYIDSRLRGNDHKNYGNEGKSYKSDIGKIIIQILICSLWFMIMIIVYRNDFLRTHFVESQFKRVTASIESHFGQRMFYFDEIFNQLGVLKWFLPVGLLSLIISCLKSRNRNFFFSLLIFFPWFLFLNLTKTKIAWYLYVIIPQFALIVVYPFQIAIKSRLLTNVLLIIIIIIVAKIVVIDNRFFTTFYSQTDENYETAIYAKRQCDRLGYLVSDNTRSTYATLKSMNLVITSTRWWGDHPSMVYYFGKKVDFIYSLSELRGYLPSMKINDCIAFDQSDSKYFNTNQTLSSLNKFNNIELYRK